MTRYDYKGNSTAAKRTFGRNFLLSTVAATALLALTVPAQAANDANKNAVFGVINILTPAFNKNSASQTVTFNNKSIEVRTTATSTTTRTSSGSSTTSAANGTPATANSDTMLLVKVDGKVIHDGRIGNVRGSTLKGLLDAVGLEPTKSANAVATQSVRAATNVTTQTISNRISSFLAKTLRGPKQAAEITLGQGMSGGDGDRKIGVWSNFNHNWLSNDNTNKVSTGRLVSGTAGIDYMVSDQFLFGIALSGENTYIDTTYNNGTKDSTGFGISPYFGAKFLDGKLIYDFMFGYGRLGNAQTELDRLIEYSYGTTRWTSATNLNYTFTSGNASFTPGIGLNFATEDMPALTDSAGFERPQSRTFVGDIKFGAKAAYDWNAFEFYTSHYYFYDAVPWFSNNSHKGDSTGELVSSVGIDWSVTDRITGTIEGSYTFLNEKVGNTGIAAALRVAF